MGQPLPATAPAEAVELDRLATTIRGLDAGSRALLDLSVRRRIRDDAMAPVLRIDPFQLAWRRARALERVASDAGESGAPAPVAAVREALTRLPEDVFAVRPQLMPPQPEPAGTALVVHSTARVLVPVPARGTTAGPGRRRRLARMRGRMRRLLGRAAA